MSVECGEPGPEGLQGWSLGPGGHSGAMGSGPCPSPSTLTPWSLPRWRAYVAAAVLCYINLLNYMNWFIIAGEEGDGRPGRHLPIYPLSALPPAGAVYPKWPSVRRLSSCAAHPCYSYPRGWFQPGLKWGRAK